jgi:hypothetical protein
MAQIKKSTVSLILILSTATALVLPQVANAWTIIGSIIGGIMTPFVVVSKIGAEIAAFFLKWVISDAAIKVSYTGSDNSVVSAGWAVTRDLANMFIVLGFVVVAIATILRIRNYEAQKLLPSLIIVAILINFSPLICGLIIDASNILTKFFLKGGVPSDLMPSLLEQLSNMFAKDDWKITVGMGAGYMLGNYISMLCFGLLFGIFIARYVILWLLVIFAPIAFLCYIFDFTKSYFKQWWDNFFKWCIMGIPAAFTLYLASMASMGGMATIPTTAGSSIGDWFGDIMTSLISFCLPAAIMLIGGYYTFKMSGAMGVAMKAAGVAIGGVALGAVAGIAKKGLTGVAGKISEKVPAVAGIGRKISSISSGVGTAMERIGLRETGTTANKLNERRKKAEGQIGNEGSDRLAEIAQSRYESTPNRAAAANLLARRGHIGKINPDKLPSIADMAASQGVPRSTLEKAAGPELAISDRKTVADLMKTRNLSQAQAEQEAIKLRIASMNRGDWTKVPASGLTPRVIALTPPQHLQTLGRIGSPEIIEHIKKVKQQPGKTMAQQTTEYQGFKKFINAQPKGSPERKNAARVIHELRVNVNFK